VIKRLIEWLKGELKRIKKIERVTKSCVGLNLLTLYLFYDQEIVAMAVDPAANVRI